jgi:chromosomal replication initiation ATPase DnaA
MYTDKIRVARRIIETYFNLDLETKCRTRSFIIARQFYYKWVRENTPMSLLEVSNSLPKLRQDHTTIIHAVKEFEDKVVLERDYLRRWQAVRGYIDLRTGNVYDEEYLVINAS